MPATEVERRIAARAAEKPSVGRPPKRREGAAEFEGVSDEALEAQLNDVLDRIEGLSTTDPLQATPRASYLAKAHRIAVELMDRQPKKKKAKPEKKTATEFEGTSDTDLEAKLTRLVAEGSPTSIVEAQRIGVELIRRQDERGAAEQKAAPKAETILPEEEAVTLGGFTEGEQVTVTHQGKTFNAVVNRLFELQVTKKRRDGRATIWSAEHGQFDVPLHALTKQAVAPAAETPPKAEAFTFRVGDRVRFQSGDETLEGTISEVLPAGKKYKSQAEVRITRDRIPRYINVDRLELIEAAETPSTPPTGPKVGDRVRYSIGTRDVEGTVTQAWTTTGGEQRVQVTYEPTAADKKMFGARARKDVRSITVDRLLPPKTAGRERVR